MGTSMHDYRALPRPLRQIRRCEETMTAEDLLYGQVVKNIGATPDAWPGGWPGEVEAALIDAVFSVRARYGNRTSGTGVYGAVTRWRAHRTVPADDLAALAATPES